MLSVYSQNQYFSNVAYMKSTNRFGSSVKAQNWTSNTEGNFFKI